MMTSLMIVASYVVFLEAVLTGIVSTSYISDGVEDHEFCQADTFEATCSDNQVLIMLKALYGRMKQNKCVIGDYGHQGCSTNALSYMNSLCSGSRQCKFRVFDTKLRESTGCPKDIASYLEASYHCIDVVYVNKGQCAGQKQIALTDQRGTLASSVSQEFGVGTIECPWVVRASSGQKISLYLRYFDTEDHFTSGPIETGRGTSSLCYDLVTLREAGSNQQTITNCEGVSGEREVYASKTNEVQVQMVGKMQLRKLGKFLVRYQVTGCADLLAPYNATSKREGDKLTIKCNNSDHTWYFFCKNSSWIGDQANCNYVSSPPWTLRQIFDPSSFPFGILLVVAIGVALGIFCGGLLLTCVVIYMKRQRRLHQSMDECADLDGYEVHAPGDLSDLATPDDDLQGHTVVGGKVIHPYTTRHYVGGQGSSSGVSSMDRASEYDKQFASMKSCGQKPVCAERCNYPSLVGKNHLYEMPHAV